MRIKLWGITLFFIIILLVPNKLFLQSQYSKGSVADSGDNIDNPIFTPTKAEEARILQNLNKIDGVFSVNKGQISNDSVRYYIQGKGVWFLDDGVVFEIFESAKSNRFEERFRNPYFLVKSSDDLDKSINRKSVVLKLNFEGVNRIIPVGRGLLPHRSNFFYGNDSSKWCINVQNFQEIIYKNLYDNIDLRYYTTVNGLKYDFIVHPGGDLNDIRLKYDGVQDLYIDTTGDLRIKTTLDDIIDSNLLIYQDSGFNKKVVKGNFKITTPDTYSFEIKDKYDKTKDLIIDPLIYSTFIGGSGIDEGWGITLDSSGNSYLTGETRSIDFPNTTGVYDNNFEGWVDIFVLKLNSGGSSLLFSTYIGGSHRDLACSISLDTSGNIYVMGDTYSSDFPYTAGAYDTNLEGEYDVVVFKLNSIGSNLLYSTYVGGADHDWPNEMIVDSTNNAYVVGLTSSVDFPYTIGAYQTIKRGDWDGFVFKLDNTGSSLLYSTFLGGKEDDGISGIAIDSNSNVYLTGHTLSNDFPNTTGAYDNSINGDEGDAFVTKINHDGSTVLYSTYIGGNDTIFCYDCGWDIKIDKNNNVYVVGGTSSIDFPVTSGAYDTTYNGGSDIFVFKMNLTSSKLVYSTFIGGTDGEGNTDSVIDINNCIYITGFTDSTDFPVENGVYDTSFNGAFDVFIVKLNPNGSLLEYSTYLGGSNFERGFGINIDSNNNVLVTGETNSTDFPVTSGAFDITYNGGNQDIFLSKLNLTKTYPPSIFDLKISEPAILRTNQIFLYSNASDIEDLEDELNPFFEYRDPNEQIWNKSWFSKSYYNNSRWEISFTPPKNATLGLYDFRVRFNDTGLLFSNWFYLNNSLTVLNNIPFVENLFLSKDKVVLSDNMSIWINGTDVEDSEKNLTIEFEYRDPNEQSWNTSYMDHPKYINEKWEHTFSIPFSAPFGYYDFRARFNDSDKDYSQWFYANDSLLLYNLRPFVVDIKLSKKIIYRTNSIFLYVNGTDYETPEQMLKFFVQLKHKKEIEWTDLTGNYSISNHQWETKINTTINSTLGFYDFRVKFIDNESASSGWQYLNDSLEVLNNKPIVINLDVSKLNVFRTKSVIINVNGNDIETQENLLKCEIQYKSPSGTWISLNGSTFDLDHWEIIFTPTMDAELGYYDIKVNITDMDNGFSDWTIIESAFEVRNNLPLISNLCDNFEVNFHIKYIDLTQYESDIEDSDKNLIWNIDQTTIDTNLFSVSIIDVSEDKIQIVPKDNVSGSDDITLTLIDKDKGLAIKSNVTIYVNSTINLTINATYAVSLSISQKSIEMGQGDLKEVTLIITNIGNTADNYDIIFGSDDFTANDIRFEMSFVSLNASDKENVTVNITVPENIKIDTSKIIFIVQSDQASDEVVLTININVKSDRKESKVNDDNFGLFVSILIIIIIVIIILILLFLLVFKKKPKKDEIMNEEKPIEKQNVQPQISKYPQYQSQQQIQLPSQPTPQYQPPQPTQVQHQITNETKLQDPDTPPLNKINQEQ